MPISEKLYSMAMGHNSPEGNALVRAFDDGTDYQETIRARDAFLELLMADGSITQDDADALCEGDDDDAPDLPDDDIPEASDDD